MATAVKPRHPHIVQRKGVLGGEPIIDGLRVGVRQVAYLHIQGVPLLDIADSLNITEAQVIHGLSYFFDNRKEILDLIKKEEQAHKSFLRHRKNQPSKLKTNKKKSFLNSTFSRKNGKGAQP